MDNPTGGPQDTPAGAARFSLRLHGLAVQMARWVPYGGTMGSAPGRYRLA